MEKNMQSVFDVFFRYLKHLRVNLIFVFFYKHFGPPFHFWTFLKCPISKTSSVSFSEFLRGREQKFTQYLYKSRESREPTVPSDAPSILIRNSYSFCIIMLYLFDYFIKLSSGVFLLTNLSTGLYVLCFLWRLITYLIQPNNSNIIYSQKQFFIFQSGVFL